MSQARTHTHTKAPAICSLFPQLPLPSFLQLGPTLFAVSVCASRPQEGHSSLQRHHIRSN